jgi:tol-pal system protein YbgF
MFGLFVPNRVIAMTRFRKIGFVIGASAGLTIGAAWADGLQSPQPARGVQLAQIFGESDDEKAARQQHEDSQDSLISGLNQKVNDLEDSVRRLTGQNEELGHRLDEANQHMIQMQKDFDYKICAMAAQQLGTTPDSSSGLSCNGGGQQQSAYGGPPMTPPSANEPDAGGAIHLAPPPGVLGTMPAGQAQPASPSTTSPDNRKQFDAAMNLLAKAQYDEASAAFRAFADANPQDDLTPQAVYWVGAIAYVQKDYPNAAHAFVEEIKKYPTSPRGPDSMLKLGLSLIAMDQKKEGCTTLAAIPGKYPDASKAVTDSAEAARKNAACH